MDSTEDCILCQREKITNETLLLLDTCLESPLTMLQVNAKENQAKELVIHSPPSLKIIPTTIDEPTQFVDSANLSHLNIIVEPTNNMHQSPLIIFIKQNPEVTVPHTITESTEVSASNVTQSNTAIVSKQQDTYDVTDMETSAVEEVSYAVLQLFLLSFIILNKVLAAIGDWALLLYFFSFNLNPIPLDFFIIIIWVGF
jgi:hypothetical protein